MDNSKYQQVNALIRQKYEADGDQVVDDYSRLSFAKHIALMKKFMGLKQGTKVLDIGCGTGAMLVELLREGADVTGIDTFEEMDGIDRKIVEARLDAEQLNADIMQASAVQMPFEDGCFDLAVSIGMLEHISPDIRADMLPEMFRVVKPGGCLFLIAGPTRMTPFDQHIPGRPFANWMSRDKKLKIAADSERRQFLEVPWGISRKELKQALPDADFCNLYGAYFSQGSGATGGGFSWHPMAMMVWAKRRFRLHKLFGLAASGFYLIGMEHCHILAIRKPVADSSR